MFQGIWFNVGLGLGFTWEELEELFCWRVLGGVKGGWSGKECGEGKYYDFF